MAADRAACRVGPAVLAPLTLLTSLMLLASCQLPRREHRHPVLIPPRTVRSNGEPAAPALVANKGYIDHAQPPATDLVQLWARDSFYVADWALHPFFVVYDQDQGIWQQWEIWAGEQFGYYRQTRPRELRYSDGRSREVTFAQRQTGAVRCWTPLSYVEWSDSEHLLHEWTGDDAQRLLAVLQRPEDYPDRDTYWLWPGPNSNGYARWVLDEAGVGLDLPPRMVGKDWHGLLGFGVGLSPTRTGLHADVLTLGATVGLLDGVELHALGLTLGVDLWPPALKTPLGRLGWPE